MNRTLPVFLLILGFITAAHSQSTFNTADSLLNKRVVKIDPLSVLTGNLTLGYEQHVRNFTSVEMKLGIIGLGIQENYSAYGAFFKIGPKIKLQKSYVTPETFASHLLRGTYIRPEFIVGYYYHDNLETADSFGGHQKLDVWNIATMLNYGVQFVSKEKITFDLYLGLGVGYSSKIKTEDDQYHYGFSNIRYNTMGSLVISTGVSIGHVLK